MRQSEDKLTFMLTLIMVSSTMIGAGVLTLPRSAAETDSPIGWIMILLQGVIFIIFSLLFLPFLQRNSGKTIFEAQQHCSGKSGWFLFECIYFPVFYRYRMFSDTDFRRGCRILSFKKHTDGGCCDHFSGSCHLSCGWGRIPHCEGICIYLPYYNYYFSHAFDV